MITTRTCKQLIEEYPRRRIQFSHTKLSIALPDGDNRDVYNISSPFSYHGGHVILGRVEYRHSEDSDVVFFCRESGEWIPDKRFQALKHLQDPFYAFIDGDLILGGVQIFQTELKKTFYRTVFLKETEPFQFQQFASGPDGMKDIRLLELSDGRVLVTTRAQGEIGGRGKIGWLILNSVDELNPKVLSSAHLFDDQFTSEEWGGTNQLHMLKNGKVGVLSHIANFDDAGNRHYYCTCFLLDPIEGEHSPMKMIAARNNFEAGESKRPDLQDVIFGGGLVRMRDGTARLYCGVGDTEAHCLSIPDPFSEWENT